MGIKATARTHSQPANSEIRLLLVDDHPIVRFGMKQLIEAEPDLRVCGEADNTSDAIKLIDTLKPHLALIDLSLHEESGIELIKQIKARGDDIKMLVLSMHDESIYAERVVRAGAMGYVNKNEAATELVTAIRQVLANHIHLSPAMTGRMLGRAMGKPSEALLASPLDAMSDRELEIFQLMGRGLTARQIADSLYLSIKTIDTYRRHIKDKLKIQSNSELTVFAANWARDHS